MASRAKPKRLPKLLRTALTDYSRDPNGKKAKVVLPILNAMNAALNDSSRSTAEHEAINTGLYTADTASCLIRMLPFFDQPIINAISTLLQTTIREFPSHSLPSYLISDTDTLQQLFDYFTQPAGSNFAHIVVRACAKLPEFVTHLYETGAVGSFVRFLGGDNFDKLATAFGTYEVLLVTHPNISADFVTRNWGIFHIQFKQLLGSPNYLVQLSFLPILVKFLTLRECRLLFMRTLDDVECLQLVMVLLPSTSRKVQNLAYSLFKLFVINPKKGPAIAGALRQNKRKLCVLVRELTLEQEQEVEQERDHVISIVERL